MRSVAQRMASLFGSGDAGAAKGQFAAVLRGSPCDVRWRAAVFHRLRAIAPAVATYLRALEVPDGTWFVWAVARVQLLPDGWPGGVGDWAVVIIGADCTRPKGSLHDR